MNHPQIEQGVRLILKGLGCDVRDRNFAETPERYARAMAELFAQREDEWATFEERYTDFILLRNHTIWTLCPHHLLPARFDVNVAYVPRQEVLGLSKLARVLQNCNTGPLLQEAFTRLVIDRVEEITGGTTGVACMVKGVHGCMQIRGVRTVGDVVTYSTSGVFRTSTELLERFFYLTGNGTK